MEWLRRQLGDRGVRSALIVDDRLPPKRISENPMYRVTLGKYAAITVLSAIYADPDAPRLARKWRTWHDFYLRYSDAQAAKLVRRAGAAGRSYAAVAASSSGPTVGRAK